MNYFSKLLGIIGIVILFFNELQGHSYKQIATLTPYSPALP